MKSFKDIRDGYKSMAQQRAVWATRKDGGKGHPDNKKKTKKEGTWAIPDNPKAKKELKTLMKKPLILGPEGDEAADKLYSIIGDDSLFDDLYVAGKKNPKGDARPIVKKHMKRLGIKEEVDLEEVTIGKMVPKHAMKNVGKSQKTFSAYIKRKTGKDVSFDDADLVVGDKTVIKGALTNDKMTVDQMVAKVKSFKEEVEEVDEGIKHDRWMRAHGKKAPAKEVGTWMFTTKEMGDVDYDNPKVVYQTKRPMKLAQAGKEAMKALGTKDVYVMEGVTEKKKETVGAFLKRGGKITKVKGGTGKAGRAAMDKFKKSYGKMKDKEAEKDQEVNEATDIFNKGGVHVTRFAMGKGKLGFQFNFGKIGRYIQIPLEKLPVLDQAVKMAKKAGKSGKQGDLPIADNVNERTDRWYQDQPEWGTPESTEHARRMTPGEYAESTAAYAKSLEKIAKDRQLAAISDKDKQTLMKIAAMLAKEKKK